MMRALLFLLIAVARLAAADSLYDEQGFHGLTADHRAYRVGDALTVLVVENSSATSSADTKTDKQGTVGASLDTVGIGSRPRIAANANVNDAFEGRGTIQRSGRLLAQLTVSVTALAPNGDLLVAGRQQIEVNDEKQTLVVEGRVRPVDVSESNTVLSSRLADARISYLGDGILGEKQHPGFLTRFLSWLRIL